MSHHSPSLDSTLGAAFVGHSVTVLLYGITSVQAFVYARRCHKDGTALKSMVFFLWILDGLHACLICVAMYWYCVTNFANFFAIEKPVWPISAMIIVSNISNTIVRCIFGYRLWVLGGHRWTLPIIIAIFCVVIFSDALYFAIKLYSLPSYLELSRDAWSLYLGLSAEAAGDLVIAIAQCVMLQSLGTGVRTSDIIIRSLIVYSINTGLLTSLCALAALISFAVDRTNFIFFAFYFVLSKLYVNALLAQLNSRGARRKITRARGAAETSTVVFRTPAPSTGPRAAHDQWDDVEEDADECIEL